MENWQLCQDLWITSVNFESGKEIATTHTPVSERALKKEDFPTFGRPKEGVGLRKALNVKNKPTMPIFRLLLGRPSRVFFSGAAVFLGGIFFLMESDGDVEKNERETKIGYR